MTEEQIKDFIRDVQQLHYDTIDKANQNTITDHGAFEEWATKMAHLHTNITVSLIFDIQEANEDSK